MTTSRLFSRRGLLVIANILVAATLAAVAWLQSRSSLPPAVLEIPCDRVADLAYSPNGEYLAVHSYKYDAPGRDAVRVFRISDQQLLFEHASEGFFNFGWNLEGSLLTIARPIHPGIDLWDPQTWTIKQHLPYPGANGFATLTFDRAGNLFAATYDSLGGEMPEWTQDRAVVWWSTGDGQQLNEQREVIEGTENVFNVAASSISNDATRLVISYQEKSPLDVRRVARQADGKWMISTQYKVPEIGRSWIRLTPDGSHLAVLETNSGTLSMYQVGDTRLDRLWSAQGQTSYAHEKAHPEYYRAGMFWPALQISQDGRLVACRFEDRCEVFDATDGHSVFQVPKGWVFAISPDSQFLAVVIRETKERIRVFRLPQLGTD